MPLRRSNRRLVKIGSSLFAAVVVSTMCTVAFSTVALSTVAGAKPAPIKLMIISQVTDPSEGQPEPEAASGAEAAVKEINAAGGLEGHKLDLISCDDQDSASSAAACARQAVSDGVAATVGDTSAWGTEIDPILLAANTAMIGDDPLELADFTSTNSFPVDPGAILVAGEAVALAKSGSTKIGVARIDNPAAAEVDLISNAALSPLHLTINNDVPVPATAPDFSSYVAQLSSDNGIEIAMNQNQGSAFIRALRSSGSTAAICAPSTTITLSSLKTLGSKANGVCISSAFPPLSSSAPGIVRFKADMKKYEPSAKLDDFSVNCWLSVKTFVAMVAQQHVTSFAPATVLAAMEKVTNLNEEGVIPNYSTTKQFSLLGLKTQLFNPNVMLEKVKNDKIVAETGKFIAPAG